MSPDSLASAVALVGSPNSGKTTLFNWLTGSKFKTVNYAGSTVDCFRGQSLPVYGEALTVLDTPGIYSLQAHGRDEEVTLETLTQTDEVKATIIVIDGTQLNRQLYIIRQIQELKLPMVVAVTMVDVVKKAGRRLDLEKLSELVDAPVVAIDGRLGGGVTELVEQTRAIAMVRGPRTMKKIDWNEERIEKEVAVAESWARQVVFKQPDRESLEHLRYWDRYLLHPIWGVIAFVVVMGLLFSSIFWLAQPIMDGVDATFSAAAASIYHLLGPTALSDFLANGVIAGIGAVLVFVPQILILFFGLTLLEDTGYLARAATVVDRPLHAVGLSGRAFVPILSGFACAVPAIMATRNIRSARERWLTIFILPFMTCSARLPVYALLLTFLFFGQAAWKAGLVLTGIYILSLFLGALAAAALNRIVKPDNHSHFLMELPIYRMPKLNFVMRIAFRRTRAYVRRAGPTIFVFGLVLWIGTHFPHHAGLTSGEQLRSSWLGQLGHVIDPLFKPLGLDWRVGLGLMSAFVAREVFVSSLAVIFSIAGQNSGSLQSSLLERMQHAHFANGAPLFTVATVTGLIVFFMIALQCLSTTGVTWRETGSLKFAVGQLVVMNVLAYGVVVLLVHGLWAIGIA